MEKINDVVKIPIKKIKRNPHQPRKIFNEDELQELASSIKSVGLIQPITVRTTGDYFELISGERRLLASQKAGLDEIPSVIIEADNNNSAIMALVENLQRKDLNFIEEANAFKKLIENHGLKQKEIAEQVGKSQSTISNKLRVLNLSQEVLDQASAYGLTERHCRALLKLTEKEIRLQVLEKINKKDLNVKQTNNLVDKINELEKKEKRKRNTKYKISSNIYINTIKKAYDSIVETGVEANFKKNEYDDRFEVTITIQK